MGVHVPEAFWVLLVDCASASAYYYIIRGRVRDPQRIGGPVDTRAFLDHLEESKISCPC